MYGHKAGDALLKTVSMCISSYIKKDDIYRRGGDEFVAICSNISEEDFLEKIELIKNKLFQTEYSASFGYTYSAKTNNIKTLIEIADENMYIDKENYKLNNPSKYKVKRKNNL
jgi:diguanylate cyclase (GGDEF)-like protein